MVAVVIHKIVVEDKEMENVWATRVDPDRRFNVEKDAFFDFVENPITPYTIGLLRLVLKNIFVRIFVYELIPPDKWTHAVCNVVLEVLRQRPTEVIFVPKTTQTQTLHAYFSKQICKRKHHRDWSFARSRKIKNKK